MKSCTYREFDSVSRVLSAARQIESGGIRCKVVPVPREFSSSCGVCVMNSTDNDDTVRSILKEKGLCPKALHIKPVPADGHRNNQWIERGEKHESGDSHDRYCRHTPR